MDKSFFSTYLGDSPFIRVLDYFIPNDIYDMSLQDIAEGTELSRNTIAKVLKQMSKLEIIKSSRVVGRAKMFQLNKQNPFVKQVMEFDWALSKKYAEIASEKDKAKVYA